MLKNASTSRTYDAIVLERDITDENKRYMRQFFAKFPNAVLRFFDVSRYLAGFNLTTSNAHISIETYYRFIIQEALPFYSKLLYLIRFIRWSTATSPNCSTPNSATMLTAQCRISISSAISI